MTLVLTCLLITVLLPYVLAGTTGYLKTQQLGSIDNHTPRAQAAQLKGAGARAVAAQANAWEAVAVLTATLAAALLAGVAPERLAAPLVIFVVARIAHGICYLADLATARSIVFLIGTVSALWMFGLAFRA